MHIRQLLRRKEADVATVDAAASVRTALALLTERGIGALVVSEDGASIAGIISDRGIMWAIDEYGVGVLGNSVGSVMTKEVFTCSREDRVSALMATMTKRRFRHIPVVEKDGRLCGIISIGDVVKHRLDEIQHEADAMREYIAGAR